jgi:hypothetical protein
MSLRSNVKKDDFPARGAERGITAMAHRDDCAPGKADNKLGDPYAVLNRLALGAATDHLGRSHRLHSHRPDIRLHRFSETVAIDHLLDHREESIYAG